MRIFAQLLRRGGASTAHWVERHCRDLLEESNGARRERLLHAAIVATDLSTWKLLRLDLGLEPTEVAAVMSELLNGLKGGELMASILMYTSPARGHLYPILGVALELRARGH